MKSNRTPYLTFDFDDLTENGLKKLIAEFKKLKQGLVDFDSNNRVTRKDREKIKKFTLFFDSGQSVTVSINETGDIVQTKLNSTIIPIDSPRSERDYAADVVKMLERNQKRFDKSLARKAARAVKDESKKRTATKTATQILNEAKETHALAQESVKQLEQEKVNLHDALLAANNKAADYRSELEKEKATTNNLIEQLEQLGVTPNV